jgi:hypothetical protein
MYQRKSSGYRPVRNVPYSSNVVENFLAPAVPQMIYPMVPVIQQPAFGMFYTDLSIYSYKFNEIKGGFCVRVVNVVDFKSLALHRCGFISIQGLRISSCEEASQLPYQMSLVLLGCLFMPEIMHK